MLKRGCHRTTPPHARPADHSPAAQTFCRKFLWHELILWPQDMPASTLLALSALDDLVPSQLVVGQCQQAGSAATLLLHPTAGHGGQLIDPAFLRCFVAHTAALVLQQPSPPFPAYAPQLQRPAGQSKAAAAAAAAAAPEQAQAQAAATTGAQPSLAALSFAQSPCLRAQQRLKAQAGPAVMPRQRAAVVTGRAAR